VNGVGLNGSTPLSTAAGKSEIEIADVLLQHGADVNARDEIGRTPLLVAILNFVDIGLLRLLLETGADVNMEDKRGLTSLWATILENGNPYILRLLLEYGADAAVPYFGKTLLEVARKNGLREFEQILLTPPNLEGEAA
jgi:ankyrin repeat protein